MRRLIFNGPPGNQPWFSIRNEANREAAEILLYDSIGKSWDDSGTGAEDFSKALKSIPQDREIIVAINSVGGSVWDGLAIYNLLEQRRERVVCRIDGIAASIASVIAMAGRKTVMSSAGQFMIHNPAGIAIGTVEDMQKMINALTSSKETLINVYEKKTGKSREEISDKMTAETWFGADAAKSFGFVDEVTDAPALSNRFDFSKFRSVPEAALRLLSIEAQYRPDEAADDQPSSDEAKQAKIDDRLNRFRNTVNDAVDLGLLKEEESSSLLWDLVLAETEEGHDRLQALVSKAK